MIREYTDDPVFARIYREDKQQLDNLVSEHDTTRSAVLRAVIHKGLKNVDPSDIHEAESD